MSQESNNRVVLFSIDGMRPDGMVKANTPVMDRMMAQGAWSLKARTVMPSYTLPCHSSMIRGVDPERHGINTNEFHPIARPVPGVIDAAHDAGKRTGFFYNWGQLRDLCDPESLDVGYLYRDAYTPEGDWAVANAAADHLSRVDFDLLFVYLGHTDEWGHKYGWMSDEYLGAIANADACVGHVLDACNASGRQSDVLLLSDHGGHGKTHGTDGEEDMTIPWLMNGPTIKSGPIESPIFIYDACPTLAHLLKIPAARQWEGRIVSEALIS